MPLSAEQRTIRKRYTTGKRRRRRIEVIACPGSGKTRLLRAIVRALLKSGTDPHRIRVLSFSNAAIDNLRQRIDRVEGGRHVHVQTCHAFARKLVTKHYLKLGRTFQTADPAGDLRTNLLVAAKYQVLRDLWAARQQQEPEESLETGRQISWLNELAVKGTGRTLTMLLDFADSMRMTPQQLAAKPAWRWIAGHHDVLSSVIREFRRAKRRANVVDFGDSIRLATKLVTEGRCRDSIAYDYLLVDEYQDTSPAQAALIAALARHIPRLLVVGDPNQSVFAFGGAQYTPLRDLLPGTEELGLSQSFRLNQHHADLANAVLAANGGRRRLTPIRGVPGNCRPRLLVRPNEAAMVRDVCQRIRHLVVSGVPASDIAVLSRMEYKLQPVRRGLAALGLGAGAASTTGTELHDVLAVLRLVRRVGPDAGAHDARAALQLADDREEREQDATAVANVAAALRKAARSTSLEGRFVVCADAYMVFRGGVRSDDWRRHLLHEWTPLCRKFQTAHDMRQHVLALMETDAVSTLTIHSAKGREWPYVFVVGASDGLLPDYRSTNAASQFQELQTLFVAVTRASTQLTVAHAPTTVVAKGRRKPVDASALSRFLDHEAVLATFSVEGSMGASK